MSKLNWIYEKGLKNFEPKPNGYKSYVESGADYEQTLAENEYAYKRYKVYPHLLSKNANLGDIDLSVMAFGSSFKIPIFLAPSGSQKMAHPDGEEATARAAAAKGTCMGVSTTCTTTYEKLKISVPDCTYLMQLYIYKNIQFSEALIKRAENLGFKAILLTVDAPTIGNRIADVKNKFGIASSMKFENFKGLLSHTNESLKSYVQSNFKSSLSWDDLKWLRSVTTLPIYLKGIMTREDAGKCLDHDVQGIIVSNHGGRQLDGVPATIDVLTEVVQAVGHRIPVYIDGGIRSGSDVFKALALGANGVFIGRPVVYGLSYNGSKGVQEVLQHITDELKSIMRLTGCRRISDINSTLIYHESQFGIYSKPKIVRLRLRPRRLCGLPPFERMNDLMPICLLDHEDTHEMISICNVKEACYLEIENEKVDKEKLDKRKYNGLVIDIRHSNFNMIKKVKSEARLPVLITGVMSKDDALECLDYQPDGIIITCQNTIDQLTAIDALPEIADVIKRRIPIYLYGGIRKGTDIIKALARGASKVFVKEPLLWAYSYKGSSGTLKALEILNSEFRRSMYLAGCKDFDAIKPSLVVSEQYSFNKSANLSKY
ncbi:uncharacterized protein [Clytia hemisphaerica]|uniref:uncharacterized protein isoform X2 n=1 Tax=Clytia hemisphaerica TaxID=252671 RepID=UPI0034D62F9F